MLFYCEQFLPAPPRAVLAAPERLVVARRWGRVTMTLGRDPAARLRPLGHHRNGVLNAVLRRHLTED